MSDRKTAVTSPYVIGTAPFRPGDEADFGGKFTEQPNDLNRPDPTSVVPMTLSNTPLV